MEKIDLHENRWGYFYIKWRFLFPKILRSKFIRTAYGIKGMGSYDLAVSLGDACFVANNLKWLKLRGPAYPFDWVACGSILKRFSFIKSRFHAYIDADDLEFTQRPGRPGVFDAFNKRTGFTFPHDFRRTNPEVLRNPLDLYGFVKDKYQRRINRLYRDSYGKRVLFIYFENSSKQDDIDASSILAELRAVSNVLQSRSVSLLYFRRGSSEGYDKKITRYADEDNEFFLVDFPKSLTKSDAWDPNDSARVFFLNVLTSVLRNE